MRLRIWILFLCSTFLFTACQETGDQTTDPAKLKRYALKGEVISVDPAQKTAVIKHEEIPGFMEPMTMTFEIRSKFDVWEDLVPGATVKGDLVVEKPDNNYWLEVQGIIAPPRAGQPPLPVRRDVAAIGKKIPDFTLTNQDGRPVSPEDFRGKAWAITFIYASCPLPEFCILMSKNFSDAANKIARTENLREKVRLLSISFDPERDTPKKLRQYGLGYLGKDSPAADFQVWQIAVGDDRRVRKIADFFGLRYEVDAEDKTQFSHSLRTAVISPDGRITKVFLGNDWTANDLIAALEEALNEN